MKQLVVVPSPPKKSSRAPQGEERRAGQRRRAIGRRTGMELRGSGVDIHGSSVDIHIEEEVRTGVERRQFRDRRRVPDRRIGVTIPANFFRDDE